VRAALEHDGPTAVTSASSPRGEGWLVVLADQPAALAVDALLPPDAQRLLHASGRPWLIGRWARRELRVHDAGRARLATLGCVGGDDDLVGRLRRARGAADITGVTRALHGSFHMIASVAGDVRAQGTIFGVRRVFHASIGGVTVAADRADVLARLLDAGLDSGQLALRLASPFIPAELERPSLWRGVHALPEDSYLVLPGRGAARSVQRWTAPAQALALEEGAVVVREALMAAVTARTSTQSRLSCDLSGGFDSTAICSIASRRSSTLTAFTSSSGDPADDDLRWADDAARQLPNLERIVVPGDRAPLPFADALHAGVAGDFPLADLRDRTSFAFLAAQLSAAGSDLHLIGDGGDEVLGSWPFHLGALVRRRPLVGWSHIRGYRALRKLSWPVVVGLVVGPRTYGAWLRARARTLAAPAPPDDRAFGVWGADFRLPAWVAPAAIDQAQDLVERAARDPAPCAAEAGQHSVISSVLQAGRATRLRNQLTAERGIALESPFLDDRVVEACLMVQAHERVTPWRYKPVLAEAMRGIMPASVLLRRTKAEYSSLVYAGYRAHRAELTALCEDSRLAELGLIDGARLAATCRGMVSVSSPMALGAFSRTLACERWLRDLERPAAGGTGGAEATQEAA
jgi:asparagine synthase (glutamine-hydrolysing)